MPFLDVIYSGKGMYSVYHTVHDTYKWLQGLLDPDFSYHLTTTQVAARSLMSVTDSIVLPFDVRQYADSLRYSFQNLNDTYGNELRRNNVTLRYIDKAIIRLVYTFPIFFLMTLLLLISFGLATPERRPEKI